MDAGLVARLRALLPITGQCAYLNHASTGPLPQAAVDAITEFARRQSLEGQVPYAECEAMVEDARTLLAGLLHVPVQTVAFTKNTSAGVILAIGTTDWQTGDSVVLMEDDFPTVLYPFDFLLPGVEQRKVASEQLVRGPEAVFRLVDARTRMVAVSWVHFLTGRRFDVESICRFCRERGVVSVIDGIQGIGVVDHDWSVAGPDFLVSHGAKWLLSPQGSGFAYVNPERQPKLKPYNLGWLSAEWVEFNDIYTLKPMKVGARRYEEGTKNYLGICGMRESLRIFSELGVTAIEERVRMLCARLRLGLRGLGFEIVTPAEPERSAGIVTCRKPGADHALLHRRLEEAKVVCSLREDMLRVAPHFYTTEAEIDRFLDVARDA